MMRKAAALDNRLRDQFGCLSTPPKPRYLTNSLPEQEADTATWIHGAVNIPDKDTIKRVQNTAALKEWQAKQECDRGNRAGGLRDDAVPLEVLNLTLPTVVTLSKFNGCP